jgi:hypothetical protein
VAGSCEHSNEPTDSIKGGELGHVQNVPFKCNLTTNLEFLRAHDEPKGSTELLQLYPVIAADALLAISTTAHLSHTYFLCFKMLLPLGVLLSSSELPYHCTAFRIVENDLDSKKC